MAIGWSKNVLCSNCNTGCNFIIKPFSTDNKITAFNASIFHYDWRHWTYSFSLHPPPLHYNPPLLSVSILQIAIRRIYALLPCRLGTYDTSKTGYYRCLLCNLSPRDCWRRNGGRQEDHNSKVVVNCRYNALTATSPCSYWPLGIHKNGYLVPHLFNISINLEWLAECYDCKRLSSESKSLSAKY